MASIPNIYDIVRGRYPASEYALMQEVRNDAGFNSNRSADFIAVGLWPSRGLRVHGIELKSYRNDWLSERKKPAKADAFFKYCDYFWLLTTDDIIAKIEEIPEPWGWLCVKGGKIKTLKDAPLNTPEPVSRGFLAAMLKRACSAADGLIHPNSIQDRIDDAFNRAKEQSDREHERSLGRLEILEQHIRQFQQASGIEISTYERNETYGTRLGEIVRMIMTDGLDRHWRKLEQMKGIIDDASKDLEKILATREPKKEIIKQ